MAKEPKQRPGKAGDDSIDHLTKPLEWADYGDTCPGWKLATTWNVSYHYVVMALDWLIHGRGDIRTIPRDWGAKLRGSDKDQFLAELMSISKRTRELRAGKATL